MARINRGSRKTMGRESASALSAAAVCSAVRRAGFVIAKLHEALMANLIATGQQQLAADLNDELKPAVDFLLHFELETSRWQPDAEDFDASDDDPDSSVD